MVISRSLEEGGEKEKKEDPSPPPPLVKKIGEGVFYGGHPSKKSVVRGSTVVRRKG